MSELLSECSLDDIDVLECPWPYYQAMHERGLYFDDRLGMFICADYALMRQILRDPELFSSVNSQNVQQMRQPPPEVVALQAQMERPVNILVSSDPPEHGRIRQLLDAPFRRRAIEQMRPQIQDVVDRTIDTLIPRGTADMVEDFAVPIPVAVIADILGLARSTAPDIKAWSDASVEPLGLLLSDERWIECAHIINDFQQFIAAELEKRKRNPQNDLLSHMVHSTDEQGARLTLGEMLGITSQLLVAGNETTTNGIAAGIQLLIDHPDQQQALREDPERLLTFVNEVLRLESPVQGLYRIATADTKLQGISIPKGARIMVRFAAANRDAKKYAQPDELDIHRRNAGTHVGFGAGIHHCLGANLAREEMLQAFSRLLQRAVNFRYPDQTNDFTHHPNLVLRGLKQLWVRFDPIEPGQC